jgi:trans-aconitate 2-methyltransferase
MRYTFGDTITANERLKKIADFFNPLAAEFISKHVTNKIESAMDLGCGPGYTTEMFAGITGAGSVIGIDISDNFLDFAKARYPDFIFMKHDVRQAPLPAKTDAIYLRFLLSHMKNIRHLVEKWLDTLNSGGYLIIDELEDIYADRKVFNDYIDMSDGLIRSQGANLFVGKKLSEELNGLHFICNISSLIPVYDQLAASWFYPNTISVWDTEEWVKFRLSKSERMKISNELLRISKLKSDKSSITWRMRRIILTNMI